MLGALVAAASTAAPAASQDDPPTTPPPTTAPPTTAPPTTAPPTTAPPTTPPPTTPPPTTEPPGDTSDPGPSSTTDPTGTTIDPDAETTSTIDDPLAEEEPPDTVPEVDVTVPPDTSGRYAGQPEFQPAEVLWSSVAEARAKLEQAQLDLRDNVAQVKSLRLRRKELQIELDLLDAQTKHTIGLLEEAEVRLRKRALSAFVQGDGAVFSTGLEYDDLLRLQVQQTMVEAIFEEDRAAIEEFSELRDRLSAEALAAYDRIRLIEDLTVEAEQSVADRHLEIEQAEREMVAFEAGSEIYINGVVFPIDGPYEVPLIDSWGFPRMTGTADEHWHEGIDIFAPAGTPLVATERGVVTRVGVGRLGGLKVWLRGQSGTDWYYAHLADFAPGLHEGQVVEFGDLLGYVGNTGNAVGTPPHLHMQIHPGGGRPVNPYPLLNVVAEREQAAADAPDGLDAG